MTSIAPLALLEWSATGVTAVSVWLAARQHIATWPTGIIGCLLYGMLFFHARLYAESTLQVFFVLTSFWGWWHWQQRRHSSQRTPREPLSPNLLMTLVVVAWVVTLGYGALLKAWTDAYAPFWDSAVLILSVIAQLLLMQARRETWPCWILVNTISVPLYLSRELYVTAMLYTLFWFNAWHGWWVWSRRGRRAA